MRKGVFLCVLMVVVLVVMCTRSVPTSSDIPADASGVLTVRSARHPQSTVIDASVTIDGVRYRTSSNGTLLLPHTLEGRVVKICGYLYTCDRIVFFEPGMTEYLLPCDERLPCQWLQSAYYDKDEDDEKVLYRPAPGAIPVQLTERALEDKYLPGAFHWAMDTINAAQPNVSYFMAHNAGRIIVDVDPNDPIFSNPTFADSWAVIKIKTDNYLITSARIMFRYSARKGDDRKHIKEAAAHELGHATGLWGHPPGGIMGGNWGIGDFSGREKEALTYVFYRTPGTRPPDDSTRVQISGRAQRFRNSDVHTIACER